MRVPAHRPKPPQFRDTDTLRLHPESRGPKRAKVKSKVKKLVLVAAAVLVPLTLLGTGALYLYFTPYFALQEIESAARRGDAAALEKRVDFPAVRASVKRQVVARIDQAVAANPNPLAAFGSALAGALSEPAVDALITPDNMARMLRGENIGAVQGPTLQLDTSKVELEYIGVNRFQAVTAPAPDGFTLILTREGWLDWKLVSVILPAGWSIQGA